MTNRTAHALELESMAQIVARLNMAAASLAEGKRWGERCVRCNALLPPCDPGESGSWSCLECSEVKR